MSFVRQILRRYPQIFKQGSYLVTSLEVGGLMGTGDLISQYVVEGRRTWQDYSGKRTVRFVSIGLFFLGPSLTRWYRTLESLCSKNSKLVGIEKMAFDQLLFAPTFLALIISVIEMSQLHSVDEIRNKLKSNYSDILLTNYMVWPAVQLVNFTLVPLKFQVLFVQIISIFWNTYFSYKTLSPDTMKQVNEKAITST